MCGVSATMIPVCSLAQGEVDVAGTSQALKSWVRTIKESEVSLLLDLAVPERRLEIWRQDANVLLPQEDASYRSLLIKLVERCFLDHDGERILKTPYLHFYQNGWSQLRNDLFYARYGLSHPWTLRAMREVILPRLSASTGQEEDLLINLSDFDALVDRHIDENIGQSSRKKTRSTVVGVLKNLGVLEPTGGNRAPLRVQQARPSPMAFSWVLHRQLVQLNAPILEENLIVHSDASVLFATHRDYARRCVESALKRGLIAREPNRSLWIHVPE